MRSFLNKWKKYFVFAGLLSCFINFLGLTFTFYMYTIYDVIVTSFSESSLITITIIAIYALVMLVFFNYLRMRLLALAGASLEVELREDVFKNMVKGFTMPVKMGYRNAVSDMHTLRDFFSTQGLYAIFDAPWSPLYIIAIFFFHISLGIISLVGTVLIFLLTIIQEKLAQNRIIEATRINQQNYQFVNSVLGSAEVIYSMGMTHTVASVWKKKDFEVVKHQTIASKYAGLIQSIFKGFQTLLQISIYGVGAYYVIKGEITAGIMIMASILEGQATRPVIQFMYSYRMTANALAAYRRLSRFLYFLEMQKKKKMTMPRPKGHLVVEHAALVVGNRILLKDVTFTLNPGEFLGIIGPSGAGKTTLCKLIVGIWPSLGGKIRLDGVDVFLWDKEQLGNYVGYLPQEVDLFPGTLAENIARMGEVDIQEVEKAVKIAGLEDVVETLPQGLNTQVVEDEKIILSGGQKQRVGFARAVYKSPVLLVLDEPNSNMDELGERKFMEHLMELKKLRSSTCILVTHRPEILAVVDKILVIKDGVGVMFGERDEVFKVLSKSRINTNPQVARTS